MNLAVSEIVKEWYITSLKEYVSQFIQCPIDKKYSKGQNILSMNEISNHGLFNEEKINGFCVRQILFCPGRKHLCLAKRTRERQEFSN